MGELGSGGEGSTLGVGAAATAATAVTDAADGAADRAATYGIASAAVVGGLINGLLNGAIGWVIVPTGVMLPLWGLPGVGVDLVAMCFGIAFGTGLGVTPMLRAKVRDGLLRAPPVSEFWTRGFASWPAGTLARALNLGALSTLVFGPPTLLLLWLGMASMGVDGLDQGGTALFKAGFGLIHGAIVTPIIGLGALLGPSPAAR